MSDTVIVIDVPLSASPEEAETLLNAPGDSYFIAAVLPTVAAHRAYFRRYKTPNPAKEPDDAVALSIVRANRDKPVRTIASLLNAAGLKRGQRWICDQIAATCAEDGNEDRAVAFLRAYPKWDATDILYHLKHAKIHRTAVWVRLKREEFAKDVSVSNSKETETSATIVLTDKS